MKKNHFIAMTIWMASAGLVWAGDGYKVDWFTVDGGGIMNADEGTPGGYQLSGTAGQSDAGATMTGSGYSLSGGYWVPVPTQAACGETPGDFDGDGDVDLVDFANYQLCYSGPGGEVAEDCQCADFDGDGDADLVDFGSFQLAFTGSM